MGPRGTGRCGGPSSSNGRHAHQANGISLRFWGAVIHCQSEIENQSCKALSVAQKNTIKTQTFPESVHRAPHWRSGHIQAILNSKGAIEWKWSSPKPGEGDGQTTNPSLWGGWSSYPDHNNYISSHEEMNSPSHTIQLVIRRNSPFGNQAMDGARPILAHANLGTPFPPKATRATARLVKEVSSTETSTVQAVRLSSSVKGVA